MRPCLIWPETRACCQGFIAVSDKNLISPNICHALIVVSNCTLKFSSARKIWPLLDLLAKIKLVLAYSCSQNFRNYSYARNFVNRAL